LPVLAFYLAFVVTITLVERVVTLDPTYNLMVFWSYKAIADGRTDLIMEIVWNIVLFVPIGFLINYIIPIKYFWISIIFSLLLSAGIETLQLVLHRGFFEFDDMIHNTIGAILGIVVFALVSLVWKKLISVSDRHL
jgi:glycopeptide antibiotics resistance protein